MNEDVADGDLISSIAFESKTGDFLAVGDKGGRIMIFEREEKRKNLSSTQDSDKKIKRKSSNDKKVNLDYKFHCEFQSHEPEFDYLKSLEIEEKINKIQWVPPQNNSRFLLSTNDKTIKLWKVHEKKVKTVTQLNGTRTPKSAKDLVVPSVEVKETLVAATPRRVFANAHAYHINSICLNSDGESYISSDDLRINLWNLSISDQSFNIVDIKPTNMEELTEVITSSEFHPNHCNLFMYSSSKGTIKLADMRSSALCDRHAKVFEETEEPTNKSFFSEIISSISDIKFSPDGKYIVSRDYMTIKIWDMAMEKKPVKTLHIHDFLRSKLCDLYENDCIFDKFECGLSPDGNHFLTGSYDNKFYVYDKNSKTEYELEATKVSSKSKTPTKSTKKETLKKGTTVSSTGKKEVNPDTIDFSRKVLHTAWHPHENLLAVGAGNNLLLFTA